MTRSSCSSCARLPALVSVVLLAAACDGRVDVAVDQDGAPGASFSDAEIRAMETITADTIRAVVAEIASDAYGGRGPGSAGDRAARRYLAGRLAQAGFQPGGRQGSWEQPFELVGLQTSVPATWSFTAGDQSIDLAWREEFMASSGVQSDRAAVDDAEVVFVGYGIQAPEYDWDDFAGADLRGKVLLMLNNDPDWDPALFGGTTRLYYGRWSYKYESAARQGAAGAIIIHTTPSAGYPWQVVQTSWGNTQFELPTGDEPRVQIAGWVTEDAARRLVGLTDYDLDALTAMARNPGFEPVPLGISTSLAVRSTLSSVTTANVLGLLPGSDPGIADEVVILMAHHDHLGVAPAVAGDSPDTDRIYNGARDNASGVGIVMAIAAAYGALAEPLRRSVLVAFVGAEEQGLLGSRYFGLDAVMPTGKMAAVLNFDGANIWGRTRDISFIGFGKSTLDDVALAVGAYTGRSVVPDQFPDRGYFYRSDQFSLARVGVPAMYLKGGSDYVGRPAGWGEEQLVAYERVDDARFGYLAGLLIANADVMPSWYPGDEFEAARLAALEAAR